MNSKAYEGKNEFNVTTFLGSKQFTAGDLTAQEAYARAWGTSDCVVEKTVDGSIVDTCYFSPKHPLWSNAKFLKWARSRGREASRRVRKANNAT